MNATSARKAAISLSRSLHSFEVTIPSTPFTRRILAHRHNALPHLRSISSRPAVKAAASSAAKTTSPTSSRPNPTISTNSPTFKPVAASKPPSQAQTPRTPPPEFELPANALTPQPNPTLQSLTDGLSDTPTPPATSPESQDWTSSFHGLSATAFPKEVSDILLQPIPFEDVEIKPDGIVYLPEIKYRRILNAAFGPGAWGLAPRGETIVSGRTVTREYALVCNGRLVSIARGEQAYFDPEGIPTAAEGCKSNALRRCCKDLGIASELWDPRWIRKFMAEYGKEVWVEHATTKKKRRHHMRKDDVVRYPWKEVGGA